MISDENSTPGAPHPAEIGANRGCSIPSRAHLRRLSDVYPKNPVYFITCCTEHRRKILERLENERIVSHAFQAAPQYHGWHVGKYVIMPDHVHFFARAGSESKSLSEFVRDWKKWTTRQAATLASIDGLVWQAEFFDHVLRSPQSYAEKWEYVRQNPVRAGLVRNPEAWPLSGECELLTF